VPAGGAAGFPAVQKQRRNPYYLLVAVLIRECGMPRLFTALEVPPQIAFSLSLLRGGLPGARWIDPENYHMTLRFIGDIDNRMADEVVRALAKVDRPSFDLSLEGLDALGGKKPHSIAACVKVSPALRELQAEHERIIQRIGLEPERRKFRPHVTLARIRTASEGDAAAYLALRGDFRTAPFPVGRFVLLSSRDSKGGGPYIMEEAYTLAA
jgi:2'-5' RNA ligase